jgi:dihydrofolate synthase/folylpolyglutamate synthase
MEAALFARARHGMKLGLDRMERALAELGHPERCAPAFHVAGTNGKGSVCAFLASACRTAGLRTGLYTSPHLEHFGERFQVDGVPASEAQLLAAYSALQSKLPWAFEGPESLTFFELVTLLGFHLFAEAGVDVMVIEVGLGGRLDATNVLTPLVSCVTRIGFDHQEYLGETIAKIAAEKAGILKPGVPAVIARQPTEASEAIERRARELGVPLFREGAEFETLTSTLGLRGGHQRSNGAVARQALRLARERGLPIADEAIEKGLAEARWPGRMETVRTSPELVLDGAHNPDGAQALVEALRQYYPRARRHLVIGVLGDKDVRGVVETLASVADTLTFTQPESPRAMPASALASLLPGPREVRIDSSAMAAVEQALLHAAPEDVVVVCGSLYLVGEVRAGLRGRQSGGPRELLAPSAR